MSSEILSTALIPNVEQNFASSATEMKAWNPSQLVCTVEV